MSTSAGLPSASPVPDALGVASTVPAPAWNTSALRFTGSGPEYFRIWVVNLLLTLLSLGIYSAWAKVRKTRYFWQNTQLDGFAFDYHARPWPILRGRILALLLLGAYSWAFDFSRAAGVAMVLALCTIGPWLFMRAQQFKFANSSWRGLRFGFDTRSVEAYRRLLPVLALWFASTLIGALFARQEWLLAIASAVAGLAFPWMHHRLKAYQHDCASWGDRRFSFAPVVGAFYSAYLAGIGIMLLAAIPSMLIVGLGSAVMVGHAPSDTVALVAGGLAMLTVYLSAGPYLAARLQQRTWNATRLGDVRFRTSIAAWPLARLALRNIGFTVLSCGLYWPFAAVAFARYRIECLQVESDRPLDDVAAGGHARASGATGDSALDAFGLDIGL